MTDDPTTLDLLDRATDGLRPDVDALVAGGVRRGLTRRRTRRAAGGLAAAGVLVLGGVLLTTARPSLEATPAGSPGYVPEHTVGPTDLAATLVRLLPPGASQPENEHINGGASDAPLLGSVRFEGAVVSVMVTDQNYGVAGPPDWAEPLARRQCRAESRSTDGVATPTTCVRRGLDWIASGAAQVYADPPGRPVAGRADLWVERFTPDGYIIRASADSRRDGQGHYAPVLTDAQLTAIVESPVWLQ